MKKLILLLVIICLASCKSKGTATSEIISKERFVIEELAGKSADAIRKIYADANIREGAGMFEEGTEERAYTILFPDTPNELHITWENEERTKMYDLRFAENGNWRSSGGIKVGTSYEELNSLNEKPVSFYGFGWDYSGAVIWNGGKLEDSKLRIFLAPAISPQGKFYGDHIIKATPEEIAALNLKVQTVMYKL